MSDKDGTVKEQLVDAVANLPDDATFEDALELVYLLMSIDRGLQQVREGKLLTNEEARQRMAHWLH